MKINKDGDVDMTNFYLWKIDTREEFELPYNKVTDLAFRVLELCLEDIGKIDVPESSISLEQYDNSKYKISRNDFAKIDYIAYMYFYFRAFLCVSEPRDFVEEHDSFFQWALIHYANTQLNLSREDVATLLQKRFETYDSIVAEAHEEMANCLMQQFVIYLKRDFFENPFGNEYHLISLFEETNLKFKVNQHVAVLIDKLISARESINEIHKTSQATKETRKPQKVHNTFQSKKEKRKSQKESLLKKLQEALGFFGVVLLLILILALVIFIASCAGMPEGDISKKTLTQETLATFDFSSWEERLETLESISIATETTRQEIMVWIPQSGKKYHSSPNCSGMKNPSRVTISKARQYGYGPCSKCYG